MLLDQLDEQSQKNASGVSQDLKHALRESIELLGNEVPYDMAYRMGRDLEVGFLLYAGSPDKVSGEVCSQRATGGKNGR